MFSWCCWWDYMTIEMTMTITMAKIFFFFTFYYYQYLFSFFYSTTSFCKKSGYFCFCCNWFYPLLYNTGKFQWCIIIYCINCYSRVLYHIWNNCWQIMFQFAVLLLLLGIPLVFLKLARMRKQNLILWLNQANTQWLWKLKFNWCNKKQTVFDDLCTHCYLSIQYHQWHSFIFYFLLFVGRRCILHKYYCC